MAKPVENTESVEFEMSQNLLKEIIFKQAGTLSKAVIELIQNSLDEKSTEIDVIIQPRFLEVTDNGSGMSYEQAKSNYRIVGESVKKEDQIGEHGMGRTQPFAFGTGLIKTQNMLISIDVTKKLGFDIISKTEPFFKGFNLKLTLYREISEYDINELKNELKKYFLISGVVIRFNGEQIPTAGAQVYSDSEITVYKSSDESDYSKIFCKGIYVRQLNTATVPRGFNINSKKLKLNFARNDFLENTEESKIIAENFRISLSKFYAKYITDYDRRKFFDDTNAVIRLLNNKYLTSENIYSLKFAKNYEGDSYYSPKFLVESKQPVFTIISEPREFRYRLANMMKNEMGGIYLEINSVVCNFLRDNFKINVNENPREYAEKVTKLREKIMEMLGKKDSKCEKVSAKASKTKKDKDLIRFASKYMSKLIAEELNIKTRETNFFANLDCEGKTDGITWIKLNDTLLDGQTYRIISKIYETLLHEYTHDSDDSNGSHASEFDTRYRKNNEKCIYLVGVFMENWTTSAKRRDILEQIGLED